MRSFPATSAIERDRALLAGDRVLEAVFGPWPRRRSAAAPEASVPGRRVASRSGLVGQAQRGAYHPLDRVRRQAKLGAGVVQALGQPRQIGGEVTFDPQHGARWRRTAISLGRLPVGAAAEHRLLT